PAACAPNTFFGASDSDKLYRCGLTGTWQPLYQAYTYPHPLRASAMGGTPAAPRNIRVVRWGPRLDVDDCMHNVVCSLHSIERQSHPDRSVVFFNDGKRQTLEHRPQRPVPLGFY